MSEIPAYFIKRWPPRPDGTLGIFLDSNKALICFTCELPWLNNEPDKSCIPAGTYQVIKHSTAAHPHTWELLGVPGRSGILIHNGNTEKDSLGCIVVGNRTSEIDGLPAVLNSDLTLSVLRDELPDNFTLTIMDA